MPAPMKRNHVWTICSPCSQHSQWRNKSIVGVHVHYIPCAACNLTINPRCKIVVAIRRPSWHAPNLDAFYPLRGWKPPTDICCENGNLNPSTGEPPRNLVNVHLNAAH